MAWDRVISLDIRLPPRTSKLADNWPELAIVVSSNGSRENKCVVLGVATPRGVEHHEQRGKFDVLRSRFALVKGTAGCATLVQESIRPRDVTIE